MLSLSKPLPVLQVCCLLLLLLTGAGCNPKKNELAIVLPVLGSVAVSDIKTGSAKATCPLKDVGFGVTGSSTISEYGLCYAGKENPTTTDTKVASGTAASAPLDIVANLTGLTPATKYFIRGYAMYEGGTIYGDQVSFLTDNLKAPEVTTADAADLSTTAFSITGKLTSLGTSDITQYGHALSATNPTPTMADSKTEMGTANTVPKDFKSTFGSLKPNTTYYVRAYATNATGTGYSEVKTVKTSADLPPTVTTADATDLTPNSLNIIGRVTSIGTLDVTQFGHCLSETNPTPTPADTKTEMGSTNAPKDFKSSFGSLKPGTTYYLRAYAVNPVGMAYSDVKTVKTANALPPTVSTSDITSVSTTGATVGMNLVAVGTNNNIQAGVCWSSTNQIPTVADTKTTNGANAPQFFANPLTNLTPGTTYYVRAYATSSIGTGYGDVKTFKTVAAQLPVVTAPISASELVGTTQLSVYGNVTSLGSSGSVQQYGHCYSTTNQSPTINDNKTTRTGLTAPGDFISTITGLTPNTTYYVRAYATSTVGTAYSEVREIKTLPVVPPVISAVKLISTPQCLANFQGTNQAFYNDPCKANSTPADPEIRVSFTYESKTETPLKFGICLLKDNTSAEPTINDAKVETGNTYTSLLGNLFGARFNVLDKTGNTKSGVDCGKCPAPGAIGPGTPCGPQTATEYILRNPFALLYDAILIGSGTKKSVSYQYRAYIIMTNGTVYYGPTTKIDAGTGTCSPG